MHNSQQAIDSCWFEKKLTTILLFQMKNSSSMNEHMHKQEATNTHSQWSNRIKQWLLRGIKEVAIN